MGRTSLDWVVVDKLLDHVRTLTHDATRSASIQEALGIEEPAEQSTAPVRIAMPSPPMPSAIGAPSVTAKAASKTESTRAPNEATKTPATKTAARAIGAVKSSAKPANAVAGDPWAEANSNLRDHPENLTCPGNRAPRTT
jgi:hypothetical protein